MKTIETTAVVGPDRKVIVQLPDDISLGEHRLIIWVDGTTQAKNIQQTMADWPMHDVGPWPEGLSLRREDMYGDDGR